LEVPVNAQLDIETDGLKTAPRLQTKQGIAADRLRSIVERIERLEEERKALGNDIRDVYGEAKSAGFSPAVIRRVVVARKKEPSDLEESDMLFDTYWRALEGE
jgi:uncharacterized protein (UPF0335 family)